ncbi:hypothetical protein CR513_32885, partial [Mucuna pruriens]
MLVTHNQAVNSSNGEEEDTLQRILRAVASLQARSDEQIRLNVEAEQRQMEADERHKKVEVRHMDDLKAAIVKAIVEKPRGAVTPPLTPSTQAFCAQPFSEEIDETNIGPPHPPSSLPNPDVYQWRQRSTELQVIPKDTARRSHELHPTEDHSLFGIDLLDKIVEEYIQLNSSSEDSEKFAEGTNEISCLEVANEEVDHEEVQDLPNFEDDHSETTDLGFEVELCELLDQVCNQEHLECTNDVKVKVAEAEESPIAQLATIFTAESRKK